MTDTLLPLQDLTRQISEHASQLEQLRREFGARQQHLAGLVSQKQELRSQLQLIEAEIRAVKQGSPAGAPAPAAPAPSAAGRPGSLAELLVAIVRSASGPISVSELASEVVRRRFPTRSSNVRNLVSTRVNELVEKGLLRRAPNKAGIVPGKSSAPRQEASDGRTKMKRRPRRHGKNKVGRTGSLRSLLLELLGKSSRPLPARELAAQALAAGYETRSKNLTDVVWTALGQLDNVENVPGEGYRLKSKRG